MALPNVLHDLIGDHKIIAMYGWAAKLHPDLYWKPMDSDTRWLKYLIEDSIDQRIVIPGESDFIFEIPEKRLEVKFCHESDIHLNGVDDDLLQHFMSKTPFLQMHWHTKDEVSGSYVIDSKQREWPGHSRRVRAAQPQETLAPMPCPKCCSTANAKPILARAARCGAAPVSGRPGEAFCCAGG